MSDYRFTARSMASNPVLLWGAFVLVHLWLGGLNLYGPGLPLGDVSYVYKTWTDQAIVSHYWVGIDGPFVYPIIAFLPMMLARTFGPEHYSGTWLSLVFVLDALAFAAIIGWGRRQRHTAIGWWWILFLLLLGPIALGRIDSITIPLGIVGVLLVASRPRVAALLLTVATWIKVWPAAVIAAMLIAAKTRVRMLAPIIVTSVVIILGSLALGSGTNVFSFISQQTTRGLQVEAPVSTIWMWLAAFRIPNTLVYYDTTMLTWQLKGPGVGTASSVMTTLLALAVLALVILAVLAVRAGASSAELLAPLALGLVTAFIAFNKVGSPQYVTWLAVPVILGLATRAAGSGRSFRVPATISLVIAALTQLIYPYLYGYVLGLDAGMLVVLTVRNLLFFVLLGWAVVAIVRAARSTAVNHEFASDDWLPEVWPFAQSRSTLTLDAPVHGASVREASVHDERK
ncbi:hypothetical protein BH09ACT1_BH09ACT1_11940 [soil metagenome]